MDSLTILKNEYLDLQNNPITNICASVGLPEENNLYHWQCTLAGPSDTSFANGLFYFDVYFPKDYPKKPPEVQFATPIYHVNVNHINQKDCALGHVCISTLNWWKPHYRMREVISNIFALFYLGNGLSPYGVDRQTEMLQNRPLYEAKIKYFTEKYANLENDYKKYNSWDFSYPNN